MVPFDGYICPVDVRQVHIPTYPEYGISVVVVKILDCVTKMFYVYVSLLDGGLYTLPMIIGKFLPRCNFAKTASDVLSVDVH